MLEIFKQISIANKEIKELENWFLNYDMQSHQYQRDIRAKGKSDIDITTLDSEAYKNAARIKELRADIENKQKELSEQMKNASTSLFAKRTS